MRPFKFKFIILSILCAAASLSGCLGDTAGVAPPDDELIFPVALSTVNSDRQLLVVNSNFDLQFNAGTLVAYSLSTVDTLGNQALSYDESIGEFTLPAGATFAEYCSAGYTSTHCYLDPAAGIAANETIRLGAYASDLNLTPSKDRALIPIRGERSIIAVDIAGGANLLDCGESNATNRKCDDAHRITSNGSVSLPIEPYDVETMDYTVRYTDSVSGNTVEAIETLGFATHRAGGEVSLFSVARQTGGGPREFSNQLIGVIDGVIEGASGLAVNPTNHDVYVVGQRDSNPHVAVLHVYTDEENQGSLLNDPWFSQTDTIRISSDLAYGTGAREVAVSPDGKSGFVITQYPPAMLKLDLESYEVSDMTTVCRESSKVDTFIDIKDPNDPLDDKLYAYVLCFLTGQVFIVDTDYMIPVIRKVGDGPQDISFDASRQLAYIANFSESTISMVQAVSPFNLIRVKEAGNGQSALIVRIGAPDSLKGN